MASPRSSTLRASCTLDMAVPFSGHGSCGRGAGQEFNDQVVDSVGDVVADSANGGQGLASRVKEFPVPIGNSWEVGAGVTTAHGDHDIAGLDRVASEDLGGGVGDVDAQFRHSGDGDRVDLIGGFGSSGANFD